jgi:hypothetical protein
MLTIDIDNPCRTRVLRVSIEEMRDGEWTSTDVQLLAPGEQVSVEIEHGRRRVEMREVPTWANTQIKPCTVD